MTQHRPESVSSDADLLTLVGRTIDHALRDQTWLWLTDQDASGFGTVILLDHAEIDGKRLQQVWSAVAQAAGTELGFVYERRGPQTLSAVDRRRLRTLLHDAAAWGLRLRGPILVHDTGLRWLGPDDLIE